MSGHKILTINRILQHKRILENSQMTNSLVHKLGLPCCSNHTSDSVLRLGSSSIPWLKTCLNHQNNTYNTRLFINITRIHVPKIFVYHTTVRLFSYFGTWHNKTKTDHGNNINDFIYVRESANYYTLIGETKSSKYFKTALSTLFKNVTLVF